MMETYSDVEVWQPALVEGYLVSSYGRVRGKTGVILKAHSGGHYQTINLVVGKNKNKTCDVHVLVATAFHGPKPEGMWVAHNDGNSHNNRADNLRWDTVSNNHADKYRHGTVRLGEAHPATSLTEANVREIRQRYAAGGVTQARLGEEFGVTFQCISNIIRGRTWGHLYG